MRRFGFVVVAVGALSSACGDGEPLPAPLPAGPDTFRVMSQNLYLGADLDVAFSSTDLRATVDQIWASVQATDFEARAELIAAGIAAADPDLVGLQEVSLWRTETPGDGALFPNATTVAYDFLETLAAALSARGLSYQVAASVTNGDIELPGSTGTDYRLTDRDVILARTSLPILSTSSGTFPHLAMLTVPSPTGGAPIQASIPRGWVSVQFRAGGRTIRFFNTHLEAFSEAVAAQQAQDLVVAANPTAQPTVVVGDMNLPPGSSGYATFVAPQAGLHDAWSEVNGGDAGLTCCWSTDLRGGGYDKRIDLVFTSGQLRPTSAFKVNESERTASGLAPSDHAGVVVAVE